MLDIYYLCRKLIALVNSAISGYMNGAVTLDLQLWLRLMPYLPQRQLSQTGRARKSMTQFPRAGSILNVHLEKAYHSCTRLSSTMMTTTQSVFLQQNIIFANIMPIPQAFQGLFLSDLVLAVLYSHFKDTGSVSPDLASPEPPKAAIALAAAAVRLLLLSCPIYIHYLYYIQVERALRCWSTGSYERPKDSKFSEAQWGPTTDEFMMNVQLLSEKKFVRIIAGAMEYAPQKSAVVLTSRMSRVSRVTVEISDDESECECFL